MKIALIIFRIGPSHGSILQTYALAEILEQLGHQVTIIDRQRPLKISDVINCCHRVVKNLLNGRFSLCDIYFGPFSRFMMKNLNMFVNNYLSHKMISVSSEKELRRIGNGDFDVYLVGSDQTWRPKYVYNIYNYFLDFVPQKRSVKRMSYASSFGTSEWEYTTEQENKCKKLIDLFNHVSVREDDGVILCRKHFDVYAEHVVDPTMLLTKDSYMKFVKEKQNDKYVGYNFLDFSYEKMSMVKTVGNSLGLPVKQLISMGDSNKKERERAAPSITEWLSGIANSEFVLVDSFHATVFCVLFHKKFITIGNEKRGISRFTSLLRMLGLEERLIVNDLTISLDLIRSEINWDLVEEKLSLMRMNSLSFLRNNLT